MLIAASSDIMFAIHSPSKLAISSVKLYNVFTNLISIGTDMLLLLPDIYKETFLDFFKNISLSTSNFLSLAKLGAGIPNTSNIIRVSTAYQSVVGSIDFFIAQNEYEDSVINIKSMLSLLDYPTTQNSVSSNADFLDIVLKISNTYEDKVTSIANYIEKTTYEHFIAAIKGVSMTIHDMIQTTFANQMHSVLAEKTIHSSCLQPNSVTLCQQAALSAANLVIKQANILWNICRFLISKPIDLVNKKQFNQSAIAIATSTANLVEVMQALKIDYSDNNRQTCTDAVKLLLDAVNYLYAFPNSTKIINEYAKIWLSESNAQEPIIDTEMDHVIDSIEPLLEVMNDKVLSQEDCKFTEKEIESKIRDQDTENFAQGFIDHTNDNDKPEKCTNGITVYREKYINSCLMDNI